MKRLMVLIAAMGVLAGCADANAYHPPKGDKVPISQETYDGLKQYLQTIGTTRPGAFAVTLSGRGYSYYYCESSMCVSSTTSYSQAALNDCRRNGATCYILAHNSDLEYEYKIVQ